MSKSTGSYVTYSIGLLVAWAIAFLLIWAIKGKPTLRPTSLVFFGFVIGWLSATIKHFLLIRQH